MPPLLRDVAFGWVWRRRLGANPPCSVLGLPLCGAQPSFPFCSEGTFCGEAKGLLPTRILSVTHLTLTNMLIIQGMHGLNVTKSLCFKEQVTAMQVVVAHMDSLKLDANGAGESDLPDGPCAAL